MVARDADLLQVLEQRGPVVPAHRGAAVDDVVTLQRGHRDGGHVREADRVGHLGEVLDDAVVDRLVEVDQVHLVDREHDVRHAQQAGQRGVSAGLLDHALAGVDEHQCEVGGRGPGDHVARVLHVARGVGHDERPHRGGEVAVGDVDGDALLALGPQAVGEQREVGVVVAAVGAGALDRLQLVLEDRLAVVEQPADEGRLAVVDGAGRGEAKEVVGH